MLMGSELRAGLESLAEGYGLRAIYAFGSRVGEIAARLKEDRGASLAPGSDVDVGVLPPWSRPLDVHEAVKLAIALEDLFDVGRVDLVLLDRADPFLAANVIRGERLFAADEVEADEFDLYVLRRVGDLAPLERERQALVLGGAI